MAINVELLTRVRDHILAEPKRISMSGFGHTARKPEPGGPACGTVACIAGWAVMLHHEDRGATVRLRENSKVIVDGRGRDIEAEAMKVLGLTSAQAGHLFYQFPRIRVQTKKYAKVVARIIDDFIAAAQ
jgi:hypothetical protein